MVAVLIICLVCLVALLIAVLASAIAYKMAFYRNPEKCAVDPYKAIKDDGTEESAFSRSLVDHLLTLPYERIYTESYDGLKLSARFYKVVGIAADCPYSSAKQIIKKVICEMGLPKDLVYPFVRLGARIFGRFDPDKCNPSDAVRSSKLPILLVHGEADGFVPLEMSMEIAEANPEIEFYAFSNADHGKSFIADTKRYKKILSEFTRRCLRL